MLLAIDIGNTNINFGVFMDKKLVNKFCIATKTYNLSTLKNKLPKIKFDDAIVCSVVPRVTRVIDKDLRRLLGKRPYIIGKDIIVPIKNLYRNPKQVGQDRLVNAYAGVSLYGAPLIMIDFGTAVTFDAVSKHKEYLGGMILPGLKISLAALAERTALLPKIKLAKPKDFIGRDTRNSMLGGIVYGFASLTDDLVKRIRDKIGKNARVIATGGDIQLIQQYCHNLHRVDRDLTLKGLNLIYHTT